jgi:AraC-like DNA-binding protein
MANPTVTAAFARGLLDLATARGAAGAALLAAAVIEPEDLADPDRRVPFEKYVALMRAAKQACNDPALGLHYGEAVSISDISIVGLIGLASATMRDAFHQLNRYVQLIVDLDEGRDRFVLEERRDGLWFIDQRGAADAFPELTESAFAHIVCGPRQKGVPPFVQEVRVTHADPGYGDEYRRIFEAPVVFASDRNAMKLDERILEHRVAQLPRYAFGILCEKADARLKDLHSAKTMRGRVESALMPVLHTGAASMESIADRLGFSRQTLFRRLQEESVTFEEIFDALRRDMALDYLRGGKTTVSEVAYLVGFSDPASFSRACKRWTGKSPSTLRASTTD